VQQDDQDLDDIISTAESYAAAEPITFHNESSLNQVTALAVGPDDRYYCCGKEDGSVIIYESTEGKRVRKVSNHTATSGVISSTWSPSGLYIVLSDDSGRAIAND
jgi:WD40 repeat protein